MSGSKLGFSLVGLVLLVFLGKHLFFFTPGILERVSSYVVYPLLVVQNKVVTPVKVFLQKRETLAVLELRHKELQEERNQLLAQTIQLRAALDHAHDIKELVDFKKRYDTSHAKLAHIILKHVSEQSHYYLLDKGSEHGIRLNMVAVNKNCLVGKVVEVYPYYSKLLLVTDTSCKVSACCVSTKVDGIHEGINNILQTSLQHVSHLDSVEVNDLVFSSGQGLIFPKGFALGKIQSYESDGLYYAIAVEPLIDVHAISYCYLITKGAELL